MRRALTMHWTGCGLLILFLGTSAAGAAPPADPLEQRIELELKDVKPEELFRTLGKMTGMEVVVDPQVRRTVSIELHNVRVRTLLDVACESIGCRWALDGGKLRVTPGPSSPAVPAKATPPTEPIDLKVTDADARDLLATFAQIMSAKAVIDDGVKGKVTLDLDDTPCDQALDLVCMAVGCDWSFDAEKRVLRVVAKRK